MGDYHLLMQFDINADQTKVGTALRTPEGVASWWTDGVSGDPGKIGSMWGTKFMDVPKPFEYKVLASGSDLVEWKVGEFPEWWAGTTIRWEIGSNPDGPGTRLMFSHRDFDPGNPVIPVITPAWAQIILRLKEHVETGRREPFLKS